MSWRDDPDVQSHLRTSSNHRWQQQGMKFAVAADRRELRQAIKALEPPAEQAEPDWWHAWATHKRMVLALLDRGGRMSDWPIGFVPLRDPQPIPRHSCKSLDSVCEDCADPDAEMCPKSDRVCGHHCDHSWSHDECCWCGKTWGEVDVNATVLHDRSTEGE